MNIHVTISVYHYQVKCPYGATGSIPRLEQKAEQAQKLKRGAPVAEVLVNEASTTRARSSPGTFLRGYSGSPSLSRLLPRLQG
jgi:hypothetical protein